MGTARLQGRQLWISIFIALVLVLKLAEVAFRIETFPLTHTGLFEEYEPPEKFPWTFRLEGRRRGPWRQIHPWYLGLKPGAFAAKLGNEPEGMEERCSTLIQQINAKRDRRMRFREARVVGTGHVRPGTGQDDLEVEIECAVEPPAVEKK